MKTHLTLLFALSFLASCGNPTVRYLNEVDSEGERLARQQISDKCTKEEKYKVLKTAADNLTTLKALDGNQYYVRETFEKNSIVNTEIDVEHPYTDRVISIITLHYTADGDNGRLDIVERTKTDAWTYPFVIKKSQDIYATVIKGICDDNYTKNPVTKKKRVYSLAFDTIKVIMDKKGSSEDKPARRDEIKRFHSIATNMPMVLSLYAGKETLAQYQKGKTSPNTYTKTTKVDLLPVDFCSRTDEITQGYCNEGRVAKDKVISVNLVAPVETGAESSKIFTIVEAK